MKNRDKMEPTTAQDWTDVAQERAADAEAMLPERRGSVGPVYIAGYAVECSLKAYLQRQGLSWRKGRGGHDLRNLWEKAGFRLSDLQDRTGTKAFYIDEWSTNLRYRTDEGFEAEALVEGARQLNGWIQKKIRRIRKRSR